MDDDVFVDNPKTDPDYIFDGPGNVGIFVEALECGLRGDVKPPILADIINCVLTAVGKSHMWISYQGIEKFTETFQEDSLKDFEKKEKKHLCLKFDGM